MIAHPVIVSSVLLQGFLSAVLTLILMRTVIWYASKKHRARISFEPACDTCGRKQGMSVTYGADCYPCHVSEIYERLRGLLVDRIQLLEDHIELEKKNIALQEENIALKEELAGRDLAEIIMKSGK